MATRDLATIYAEEINNPMDARTARNGVSYTNKYKINNNADTNESGPGNTPQTAFMHNVTNTRITNMAKAAEE